ncbi:replication endonuclease [Marinobacter sp. CA1]|uniref:replication endonuclease n=1 Tax=Marinobacter sp. CA1 TaxID=2817656 RepID=UPI001D07A9E1|nr:replication endonuclease [Marinobacter sp. CA1]UDL07106.1 replication endonuclease [Marinobacter sp. CA1]
MEHADDEVVEKARQAVDKSDWAGFIEAMNDPCAKRADQPIKTANWTTGLKIAATRLTEGARVRAALQRKGIDWYGIRTVEPHHDGTPHWHLLMFMDKEAIPVANQVFREHALQEDGEEHGAAENRFVIEEIDPEKGRATGYVTKYISKSIDGYEVGEDSYGNDAVESAARIRAWASIWGIRQFQFMGAPSVTVYRELRRLRNTEQLKEGLLADLEQAADNGEWKRYVELMGGVCLPQKDMPLRALMIPRPSETKYYEVAQKLHGLIGSAGRVEVDPKFWTGAQALIHHLHKEENHEQETQAIQRIIQVQSRSGRAQG